MLHLSFVVFLKLCMANVFFFWTVRRITCTCKVNCFYLLYASQDECSFVSLRDVDRTLQVMMWFFGQPEIFDKINEKAVAYIQKNADPDTEFVDYKVCKVIYLVKFFFFSSYLEVLIILHED